MKKMILAGNTHFDPVWLWNWDEAMSSITATFRAALKRMEEYPDFTYSFSAPAVFEWIEKTDPELFEKIRERIAEGRWELCEGWWLQADCNAASGESYVRQGLYAQRYFREKFGKQSEIVFNIDSFGHPATLPQILCGCGIKNYVFWRPNAEMKELPAPLFCWKGTDGSAVRAYRIGGSGGEIFTVDLKEQSLKPLIAEMEKDGKDRLLVYGVTDHGGAPTVRMIREILEAKKEQTGKTDVRFGRVDEFFRTCADGELPTVDDELQVNFIGPYSNFTEIKKNNRRSEYAAQNAERVALLSQRICGTAYPAEEIRGVWRDIMFNQFHDILGGCCIENAYAEARDRHGRALQNAGEIIRFGLQRITNRVRMCGKNPDNAWNLVVWNLNAFDVTTEVEAEVQWAWEFDWYRGGIELCDERGNIIPCQIITELPVLPGFRSRFVFRAELPALGYRSYIVRQTRKPVKKAENGRTENERFRLSLAPDGTPSLYDKNAERELLSELFRPYVLGDFCDTWGFNKTVYEDGYQPMTLQSVQTTEDGNIRTAVRLVWEYRKSTVEQTLLLYADHVECRYRVLWNEERCALKFGIATGKALSTEVSAPYGHVAREKSPYERPMGEWISLCDGQTTADVCADSTFAYRHEGDRVGFTVLRNALYGDLRTEDLDPERVYRYMGQGVSEGRFRVSFPEKDAALPDREGIVFNNPPVVLCEANHGGTLEPAASFLSSDGDATVTAVKQTEDGGAAVIRLYNSGKDIAKGHLSFAGCCGEYLLKPGEIQTLLTVKGGFRRADLLEQPIEQ